MEKYDVLSHLIHNGKSYDEGSQVELTKEQAKPLIELGVVKKAADQGKKGKEGDKK